MSASSGALLVGESRDGAARVQVEQIQIVISDRVIEESPIAAMKGKLRYWIGHFDLGLSFSQGTVDTTTFNVSLGAERRKGPDRLYLNSGFIYGTQKQRGETQTKLADQLFGEIRPEHDLTERVFVYGDGYAEYNAIQRISIRGIPGAGFGYKFWKPEEKDSREFFAGTIGGSWVYEKYFGGDDRNYFAIAFGLQTESRCPTTPSSPPARSTFLPSTTSRRTIWSARGPISHFLCGSSSPSSSRSPTTTTTRRRPARASTT